MAMAGKYHRTYLREHTQAGFDKMQSETGRASNDYFAQAVREKLEADGYLKPVARLKSGAELLAEQEAEKQAQNQTQEPVRRRRRRAQ